MLSGVIQVVYSILVAIVAHPEEIRWLIVLYIAQVLLMLGGLIGLHILQKEHYGRIGEAGFYTVIAASLAQIVALVLVQIIGLVVVVLGNDDALERIIRMGDLFALVGLVMIGVATLQARVLPRWCGLGLIIIQPLAMTLEEFGGTLFGLFWLALGYMLWSKSVHEPSSLRE
jgi:hypothetical protein